MTNLFDYKKDRRNYDQRCLDTENYYSTSDPLDIQKWQQQINADRLNHEAKLITNGHSPYTQKSISQIDQLLNQTGFKYIKDVLDIEDRKEIYISAANPPEWVNQHPHYDPETQQIKKALSFLYRDLNQTNKSD